MSGEAKQSFKLWKLHKIKRKKLVFPDSVGLLLLIGARLWEKWRDQLRQRQQQSWQFRTGLKTDTKHKTKTDSKKYEYWEIDGHRERL